jgi:hypothetical protein
MTRPWWRPAWWGRRPPGGRTTGNPTSSNGASSLHLWWLLDEPLTEVAVTLEVVVPPPGDRLVFWALQAGFSDGTRPHGAGHLGLQAHPRHPGGTAVNWGGYRAASMGGGELDGSESPLPSALGNRNTRDFPWGPRRPYRLRIRRSAAGTGWTGSVTDLAAGVLTEVRDLHGGGHLLEHALVWSEDFSRCDAPSTVVRWSAFEGVGPDGRTVRPAGVRVGYQSEADGGCSNTSARLDGPGVLQVTNTRREVAAGSVLPL